MQIDPDLAYGSLHCRTRGSCLNAVGLCNWGYVYLPSIVRNFLTDQPNILIDIEVVDHSSRLDGLRNGTYDLAFGIIDPAMELFYSLNFQKMTAEGFCVYGDESHPLAGRSDINDADLSSYSWVNHRFEFGLYDETSMPHRRDYTLKVNSLLNTLQSIKGTDLLISASSGLKPLFATFALTSICADKTRPVLPSGAIHWDSLDERPDLKKFVALAMQQSSNAT